jgi:threonine dehydrogenase-like Zn-dependent dehydrogenase
VRRAPVEPGDVVAVVGIGFLGALIVQLAKARGATVIAISRRPFALEVAAQAGADYVFGLEDEPLDEVAELTENGLCDVVIEATGRQGPLELAGELTRTRGRLAIAGFHQDGPRTIDMQLWNWRGLDVVNAHEREPEAYLRGLREAVELVEKGVLDPRPVYTHSFELGRIGDAFRIAAERPDGFLKALVTA